MDFKTALGESFHHFRVASEKSQHTVFKETGIAESSISGIEWGQIDARITTLLRYANAIDTPLSRIVSRAERISAHG